MLPTPRPPLPSPRARRPARRHAPPRRRRRGRRRRPRAAARRPRRRRSADRYVRRPIGRTRTASRTSPATASATSASASGYAAGADLDLHPRRHPDHRAAASARAGSARTRRYDDQVTLEATNLQVDAFVTDLRNRQVVEKLLADRDRRPRPRRPGRWCAATPPAPTAGCARPAPTASPTPPARAARYLRARRPPPLDLWYGVYLANLLASGGVFVKQIVDADAALAGRPGPAGPGRRRDVDRDALLAALGRDPSRRSAPTRPRSAATRTDHRPGHAARQPALPVARPLPLHPAAPDDPRSYDVAGASLIGSPVVNIGWNQRRRLEPHRLDGLPLHAVRVPRSPARTTYLTDGRPAAARAPQGHGHGPHEGRRSSSGDEDLYRTAEGYVADAPAR